MIFFKLAKYKKKINNMFSRIKRVLSPKKDEGVRKAEEKEVSVSEEKQYEYPPKTQRDEVMHHLNELGSITSMEAFSEYGITRLSGIIHSLRHDMNVKIKSIPMTKRNRYGNVVNFSKYTLCENGK